MTRRLTRAQGQAAVMGGALLGGGGGGDPSWGLALAEAAFDCGEVRLASVDELPTDATVATAALVGAPADPRAHVTPQHYWQALEHLMSHSGRVDALVTNENGGLATVNGWYQAARAGVPVLDCPGNGRAHPTGLMGSFGLDLLPVYRAAQACAGGRDDLSVSVVVQGNLASCARVIRAASVEAGGLVAVARNPATAAHIAANGAPGAITQAIELGVAVLAEQQPAQRIAAAASYLGPGTIAVAARLERLELRTEHGFDLGDLHLVDDAGRRWRMRFWNEYITAEAGGKTVAVFPDLITTMDLVSGQPLTTAAIARLQAGHPVGLLLAPREALRLAATMTRPDLLGQVAHALGWPELPERDGAA